MSTHLGACTPAAASSLASALRVPLARPLRAPPAAQLHWLRRPLAPAATSQTLPLCPPPPPTSTSATSHRCPSLLAAHAAHSKPFSTSTALAARKKDEVRRDRRVTLIRYFLYHPLTPSPLRFSRNRYLRHWTIHRAWQLYLAKRRRAHKLELERQFRAMHAANEELRTGAGDGGWLFKRAMSKHRLYKGPVPIEYGRLQTETPSKFGWNYEWKRPEA